MNPVFEKFGHLPVWAISYTTAMGRSYSFPLTPYLPNDKGILNTVVGDTKGITLAECHDWIAMQRDSVRSSIAAVLATCCRSSPPIQRCTRIGKALRLSFLVG